MRKSCCSVVVALVLGLAARASANPEPVMLYDARSAAMGGTGIAFIDNASAIYHNPANLELVGQGSATAVVTPFVPVTEAPFAGPGTDGRSVQESNSGRVAPLFFGGGAYRVHERVVLGLGAFVSTGVGSSFDEVDAYRGQKMDLQFAAGELVLPASVRVTDKLSVGLGVRLLYAVQDTDVYDPMRRGRAKQSLDGFGFPGFRVGVLYQPTDTVSLAMTYRSPVTVNLEGSTRLQNEAYPDEPLPTQSEWSVPHAFRLGGAYSLLDDELLLSLEMKLQLHAAANDKQVYRVDVGGTDIEPLVGTDEIKQVVALDWRNVLSFLVGIEYRVQPWLPVRFGYTAGVSATPRHRVNPFMPPPGLSHAVSVGTGLPLGDFQVDLAGAYAFAEATVEQDAPEGAAGHYETDAFFLSASISYSL
jgi:long-subunit fatty acid transport protein